MNKLILVVLAGNLYLVADFYQFLDQMILGRDLLLIYCKQASILDNPHVQGVCVTQRASCQWDEVLEHGFYLYFTLLTIRPLSPIGNHRNDNHTLP